MAFVNVKEMTKKEKDIREQEPVKATYSINRKNAGFLFQIDTYGRDSRANPDKISQSISFDAENLQFFVNLLNKEFPSLFNKTENDTTNYSNNYVEKTYSSSLFEKLSQDLLHPLILYGPPGTGKTYKMQHEYIDKFAKEDRFITTFHQSFSYEEFVEGLKPVLADKPDGDKSSDVKYKIEKGIFYKACERAAELAGFASFQDCISASDRNEKMDEAIKENKIVLLCIDEINRANVSSVFGDLISLIEPSKRIGADNEMIVQLPYSKEDFAVPANLMIVGTMNTADRSIQLLDSALRRRFRFEELLPDYEKIENATAKEILQKINARIRCLLDKDHQIGHSYFIEAKNDLDIFNALKDSVIPLLEEYFYNDAQKIRQILNENDNTDNAFYIKDEESENASRLIQNDYDD
ncbi:AAA family ATPase [bacterium]|nr:AAA family ATPase [bacterium]